eukprot:TRINITY_DN1312_c0_g2_i1.p1 TRINITY_DN1312_c0_g2~~TRINITY_DN1312_c0_g2_i1.p1  ORF type:complete len:212 (-),score=25.88 TRINITY_DN1312_c0_g2_i1:36-671(-)
MWSTAIQQVFIHALVVLDVIIESIPKVVGPRQQRVGNFRVLVGNLFTHKSMVAFEYRYCSRGLCRLKDGSAIKSTLKIPINILMFCKGLYLTTEEYQHLLITLAKDKMEGSFDLDIVNIRSMDKLRRIITADNTAVLYDIGPKQKGVLHAALVYNSLGEKSGVGSFEASVEGLISVKVNEIGKSYLAVYSKSQMFREVIVTNLLDIIACIR